MEINGKINDLVRGRTAEGCPTAVGRRLHTVYTACCTPALRKASRANCVRNGR